MTMRHRPPSRPTELAHANVTTQETQNVTEQQSLDVHRVTAVSSRLEERLLHIGEQKTLLEF